MKKILSKRGFSIVEVLVAFVIFAIMAGMVSVIVAQTSFARQQNTDIQEETRKLYTISRIRKRNTIPQKKKVSLPLILMERRLSALITTLEIPMPRTMKT